MVETSGKIRIGGNLLFLNSTANIVRLEMLEAFSLKSETRQIYSPHYCSKLHWNTKPEIRI